MGREVKNPLLCRCDVGTIDYSKVDEGRLICRACRRVWKFIPGSGWSPTPLTRHAPHG
jgi:hypothetical protein